MPLVYYIDSDNLSGRLTTRMSYVFFFLLEPSTNPGQKYRNSLRILCHLCPLYHPWTMLKVPETSSQFNTVFNTGGVGVGGEKRAETYKLKLGKWENSKPHGKQNWQKNEKFYWLVTSLPMYLESISVHNRL